VSLFASIGAGCAAIAGLGDLEKVDCASDCDGGPDDVTSGDDGSTHDVVVSDSLGSHDSSTDATNADSAGGDTSTSDTGSDATAADAMDASVDADAIADSMTTDEPDVVEPPDAAPDSGCGPIDTTTNCGACGATCTETHATADTCNGTACSYTCGSGFQDCNAANEHNTDGCECAGTACCSGGTCQTAHSNGVGETFYDCIASGVYDINQATEACFAFTGNAQYCMPGGYYTCTDMNDAGLGDMLCSDTSPTACDCWGFSGAIQGHVSHGAAMMGCACPYPTNIYPSWN